MNYTIATMKEVHTDFEITYEKSGNLYNVLIIYCDGDERIMHYNQYENADEACNVYLTLAEAILKGMYSLKDRIAILEGEYRG